MGSGKAVVVALLGCTLTTSTDGVFGTRVCGLEGVACCSPDACNSGLECRNNECVRPPPCGGDGEGCCAQTSCNTGLYCDMSSCAPVLPEPPAAPCGGRGADVLRGQRMQRRPGLQHRQVRRVRELPAAVLLERRLPRRHRMHRRHLSGLLRQVPQPRGLSPRVCREGLLRSGQAVLLRRRSGRARRLEVGVLSGLLRRGEQAAEPYPRRNAPDVALSCQVGKKPAPDAAGDAP